MLFSALFLFEFVDEILQRVRIQVFLVQAFEVRPELFLVIVGVCMGLVFLEVIQNAEAGEVHAFQRVVMVMVMFMFVMVVMVFTASAFVIIILIGVDRLIVFQIMRDLFFKDGETAFSGVRDFFKKLRFFLF